MSRCRNLICDRSRILGFTLDTKDCAQGAYNYRALERQEAIVATLYRQSKPRRENTISSERPRDASQERDESSTRTKAASLDSPAMRCQSEAVDIDSTDMGTSGVG